MTNDGDERVLRGAREAAAAEVRRVRRPRRARTTDRPRVTRSAARPSSGMGARQAESPLCFGAYFDGHFVIIEPGSATNVPRSELAVDHDVPPDLEEVGHGARVPDGDRRASPSPPMSLSLKRRPPACASPRTGPTTRPASCTVAGAARELARSERGIPAARDRRVQQEDGEHRRHRERDHEPRRTAPSDGHAGESSPGRSAGRV